VLYGVFWATIVPFSLSVTRKNALFSIDRKNYGTMADRTETTEPPVDTGASLQGQRTLPDTTGDHLAMGNVDESHSFDVAEALEADLGNLHPEDEALIESVVAAGETTQATQDSQQATAAAAPTEATTATAPAAAAAPKKTRKRGFSYARKKLVATKEVYLKPGCTYHGDQSLVGTITACPRKGKTTYTVAWNGQLPVGLHFDFLRTEFPKDTGPGIKGTNCAVLKAACEAYEQQQPARQQQAPNSVAAATAAAAEAIGRSTAQSASESRSESRRSSTEPLSAAAAAAQLRVSPDTIPVNPPPEQPTTQRPSTRASVDGYVSEDSIVVDGNDMDESDNGYQSMPPLCDMWESDSGSEDSEAMPDRDATAPRNPADYDRTNWSHLASSLVWDFEEIEPEAEIDPPSTTPYERSDGNSNGCLKPGVAASFKSPLDCAEVCGGLTHEMVKRLTVQSNLYAEEVLKPQYVGGRVEGSPWKKITIAEMYRFLGLMLKISISPLNLGGYEAYFSNKFRTVTYDGIYKMDIDVNVGWAAKYMSLKRFRQVRRAFHPEHRAAAAAGDKCYQLRYALNCLNQASLNTYIPGRDLSFDEGGVSMRSRLCPVRQYNKDKPNKF
jgi:hypothetical protein